MGACLQLPREFLGWNRRLRGPETSKQMTPRSLSQPDPQGRCCPVPGAHGVRAFERVPLIPGFRKAPGNAHRGDSSLQHSPGAGIQHRDLQPGPLASPSKVWGVSGIRSVRSIITFRACSCRVEKGRTRQGMDPGAIMGSQPHLCHTNLGCHEGSISFSSLQPTDSSAS